MTRITVTDPEIAAPTPSTLTELGIR
ncbi:MAG: hypothetical protein QG638_705, partial [Pseudomonadota bacterium]|nr:hypothetical protein [Pseudomonadota bacterium]